MLIPRIITAVFLVAFMLGGLFYLPAPYWPAFAAVIILPALWEWTRLFHITGLAQIGYLGFSALMMYAVASTGQMPGAGMQVLSLLMWLVVAPLWLWRRWKLVDRNQAAMLGWLLLMPAWTAGGCTGVKIVHVNPANTSRRLPAVHAAYLLSSAVTGAPCPAVCSRWARVRLRRSMFASLSTLRKEAIRAGSSLSPSEALATLPMVRLRLRTPSSSKTWAMRPSASVTESTVDGLRAMRGNWPPTPATGCGSEPSSSSIT